MTSTSQGGGSLARRLLRAGQTLVPAGGAGVTLLAYHLVGAGTSAKVDLPTSEFVRQLDELPDLGRIVSLEAALDALESGVTPDREWIVLSFDDAFENFYTSVWPLLRARGLPSSLFVPVGFVDGSSPAPLAGAEHLAPATWSQLREMSDSGSVRIGSHTWSHPDLRPLEARDVARELTDSRRALEDRLGTSVDLFCYPRGLWNRDVAERVLEAYRAGLVGGGRKLHPATFHPARVSRVPVRRDGPRSLRPVVESGLWLEEAVADAVRRHWRRPRS